jgi:hypothetical protein
MFVTVAAIYQLSFKLPIRKVKGKNEKREKIVDEKK